MKHYPKFSWLGVLMVALIGIQLFLVVRHESTGQLGITLVCWAAVLVSVSRRQGIVQPARSVPVGRLLGAVIIAGLLAGALWRGVSWTHYLALYPILAGLGLALLKAGFAGIIHFRRELLILFSLGIPHGFLLGFIDLTRATAYFSGFLLHYLGKEVVLHGTEIALPGGAVEVVKSCDGTSAMAYLACLAVVFLVLFPLKRWQRVVMIPLAMTIAFATNGVRVALLAVIESSAGAHAFDYWHTGTGAMLWTGLPVLVFGLVCFLVLHFQMRSTELSATTEIRGRS